MRTFVGLLFTVIALNCALAGPVRSPNDDAEIVDVPRRGGASSSDVDGFWDDGTKDFKGVISTNVGYPFLQPAPEIPSPFLFRFGSAGSFEDIFRRLHGGLSWLGLGLGGDNDGSADPFGVEPFGLNIPDSVPKNGTTSTVKVVGGHKVEINETTYGDDNSVFKVRVVNIRPADSGEDAKPTEAENPDVKKTETNNVNPVTSGPEIKTPEEKSEAENERREPLEKNDADNEVRDLNTVNNEYLTVSQQNNTIMLPRRIAAQNNNSNVARLNAAFVADNSIEEMNLELKLKQYEQKEQQKQQEQEQELDDDGTKSISASGNIEAETNKLELVDNDEFDKYKSGDDSSASASNTIVRKDRLTMEYNEETEEQKNLNESSVDFDETANWNGHVTEDEAEDEKNHEFQVTTPLELSIATAQGFVVTDYDYNDEQKKHAFEKVIDKITTISTTADEKEEDKEDVTLNLAINRDREDVESSGDEYERHTEMSEAFNSEWADLNEQENLAKNSSNNDDSYEIHVPADLSNDIIVNDYAAAHNVPFNPDAEFIDVTSMTLKNSSMPILENLSMK